MDAIDHAKRIGTYGMPDRSKQYPLVSEKQIVDAVNLALTKVRLVEKSKDTEIAALKEQVKHYKWANIALTSVLTGLAWEGCKALIDYLVYR